MESLRLVKKLSEEGNSQLPHLARTLAHSEACGNLTVEQIDEFRMGLSWINSFLGSNLKSERTAEDHYRDGYVDCLLEIAAAIQREMDSK